jgi:hypothetical protein
MANSWSFAMPIPLRPDFDAAAMWIGVQKGPR